ncbi:hypothetical protein [Acetobacter estunensis]|nr:hypothetical protein [Acetobacter estunensis]
MVPTDSHLRPGMHVITDGLPPDTIISGISPPEQQVITLFTATETLPDAEQSPIAPSHGMATALIVNAPAIIPSGASISAPGLPSGTHIISVSGKTLYTDQPVSTLIPSGTPLHLTWQSSPIWFSRNWMTNAHAGQPIGFWQQDDYRAFEEAAWWNDLEHGGNNARIFVPGGVYYLSKTVYTRNGTSFELAPNVRFIYGSASIDSSDGNAPAFSQVSFLASGHNKMPTTVNITQELYQRSLPDIQGQALLIAQDNANCLNDGSGWGCGMVGAEVKQHVNKFVRRGFLWEYHGTDQIEPGQHIPWAGLEAEIANNSGWWGAFAGNALNGNTLGLHIDNIAPGPGHVPTSYALDPAGDWHTMAQCDATILDWCIAHHDGLYSNQQPMPDSGIDSKGRIFGNQFITMQTAPDTATSGVISAGVTAAATRTATIDKDGQIGATSVNTPILENATSGISDIIIEEPGRFNAPVTLSIGRPPQGGTPARAEVASYSLRALQGGIAMNATDHSNAPDGVTVGMTFALTGGRCTTHPTVRYDGTLFTVTHPGNCSVLPDAITPEGMKRTVLTLSWISGGNGPPSVEPVVEPLYGIRSIRITDPGSGYNAAVPPDILAITHFSGAAWRGIIYTPIKLRAETGGGQMHQNPIRLAAIHAENLPTPCEPGEIAFVPDIRNNGETVGHGTGSLVWCTTERQWLSSSGPLRK